MSNSTKKPDLRIEGTFKQEVSKLKQSSKQLRLLTLFLFVPVTAISVLYLLFSQLFPIVQQPVAQILKLNCETVYFVIYLCPEMHFSSGS